jgi:hypothetical protein
MELTQMKYEGLEFINNRCILQNEPEGNVLFKGGWFMTDYQLESNRVDISRDKQVV